MGHCINHLDQLPESLGEDCHELISAAVKLQIQRLEYLKAAGGEGEKFRLQHTRTVLEGQRHQGSIIFWVVLIIVSLGVVAAAFQFYLSFTTGGDSGSSEIVISNNQFKFQTTWLGALLLGMSMGFLFLYLIFFYMYIGL